MVCCDGVVSCRLRFVSVVTPDTHGSCYDFDPFPAPITLTTRVLVSSMSFPDDIHDSCYNFGPFFSRMTLMTLVSISFHALPTCSVILSSFVSPCYSFVLVCPLVVLPHRVSLLRDTYTIVRPNRYEHLRPRRLACYVRAVDPGWDLAPVPTPSARGAFVLRHHLYSQIWYPHITDTSEISSALVAYGDSQRSVILHHLAPQVRLVHRTYFDVPQFYASLERPVGFLTPVQRTQFSFSEIVLIHISVQDEPPAKVLCFLVDGNLIRGNVHRRKIL
ncbi:hypothetical protein EV421DRAFT_1138628 [Armillaria borealis]|uniref:Uncharacterized protein n=1 Tax=Armillaria borealis TaxID=47425 RepID=A0AA39J4U9_9AGAR|nr:hypothetical protein EV421DRAFT_1138628 [Armillaria borealis]